MERRTTGHELRMERTDARIRQNRIASLMGVSISRVSHLETQEFVSDETAVRYRAALDTCRTGTGQGE